MVDNQNEIKQFLHDFIHLFYCKQDIKSVYHKLAINATWIGPGENHAFQAREEFLYYFSRPEALLPSYNIKIEEYHIDQLSPSLFRCNSTILLTLNDLLFHENECILRLFVLLEFENGVFKFRQVDSFLDHSISEDKLYLKHQLKKMRTLLVNKDFEINNALGTQKKAFEELTQTNRQMQVILSAIKGGLKISRDDESYSYLYVSDELCNMFGYTKEEFLLATGGTAVGAVYPPDLPIVMRECAEAFQDGSLEYAIKYRVACHDGTLKWIIDSGKKTIAENGETIINSIYLDVTEMEQANLKIAEQKEYLDSIYNSVTCGILRYCIEKNEFKSISLNQEALRILGYKSEEDCHQLGIAEFYERIFDSDRTSFLYHVFALKEVGDSFKSEYRIKTADGNFLWVYGTMTLLEETNHNRIFQCIMVDTTEKKQLELALEEEHSRFRIAIESTPVIVFEYNILLDQYSSYGTLEDFREKHNVEIFVDHYLGNHIDQQIVKSFQEQFRAFLCGNAGNKMELQMAPFYGSKDVVWAFVTITPIYDEGKLIKVIGKITNIQSEKEKEIALEESKSRDSLTGLYHKEAGIRMVQDYLKIKSSLEVCAMMILDMDDFKQINQEEGSVFADAILQEVSEILLSETSKDDIQVRLGGDEFMLFIKNCNKARATIIGPKIADQIQNLIMKSEKNIKISASIGMCVTSVVEEYSGLYRCAESTLKYVKEHGRGRAACYLDTSNEIGIMLTQVYTEQYYVNEIETQSPYRGEDLVSFALDLLGKSQNLDDAVFLLLSRVGRTYHFDRISIMDAEPDYLSFRFSYQWAKDQTDLQMGQDFYLTKEDFVSISQSYGTDGLCSRCISSITGGDFHSCLHAAIWDHGIYSGLLSFEMKDDGYLWTEEQCKLLKELVKVIPSFIMKARADAVSQAKTDFLSRMSHEIRTPMNAISGMTTLAKTVLDDKEHTLNCLEKIESANSYLLNLINDILDMSKIESGKMELGLESIDLIQRIEDLESLMTPQADAKGITLKFVIDQLKHRIIADALRLNQVLINIIGNAIKFTPPNGNITALIKTVNRTEKDVTILFSVKDNGIGISDTAIERIFNSFEQGNKKTAVKYGGTGLGLAISYRLVQMMGGVLEVTSKEGEGAEFFFTLTLDYDVQTKEPPSINESTNLKNFDFAGKRVLLVEDNELNQEIAEEILKMKKLVVETAINGKDAIEHFHNHPPYYYQAILMDIRMPVMDGLEATKQIRTLGKEDSRSIPIIAMTANAFDEDTKKSIEYGMNGHLTKPIDVKLLFRVLKDCLIKGERS